MRFYYIYMEYKLILSCHRPLEELLPADPLPLPLPRPPDLGGGDLGRKFSMRSLDPVVLPSSK